MPIDPPPSLPPSPSQMQCEVNRSGRGSNPFDTHHCQPVQVVYMDTPRLSDTNTLMFTEEQG